MDLGDLEVFVEELRTWHYYDEFVDASSRESIAHIHDNFIIPDEISSVHQYSKYLLEYFLNLVKYDIIKSIDSQVIFKTLNSSRKTMMKK